YRWLHEYLLQKSGARTDFKAEWQWQRYLLADKMFAALCGPQGHRPLLSVKCAPAHGLMLREQYPGQIIPGYYMNKVHWNSVVLTGDVPDDVVRQMIDESHALILASLPKKLRQELLGTQA
ncbi:MAG: MmcQ/YjbR family DNA-binding protein, partial [Eubacteriales bacterium]|nr:MmcQ/YjbR family DNA-binding protein [Eubacteriales bacterium]